ncbi:MAG: tyrosine-type recombinase/integrase [Aminipila sp.]
MYFTDVATEYINSIKTKDYSENTIMGYTIDVETFKKWLCKRELQIIEIESVTRKVIREYIDFLQQKYKYKTIRRKITALRNVLNYAYEYGTIDTNPFWGMNIRIKNKSELPSVMELSEVNKFLYVVHNAPGRKYGENTHRRDIAIIELLFCTGIRVNELANLKYTDWDDLEHCFKYVAKGKKMKAAFIDNKEVLKALKDYMNAVKDIGSEYIFLSKLNKKISTSAVREIVKKYANKAGIPKKITPHTFRRSYATMLIDSGLDITYVKEALGHSSITTTQFYIRLSNEATRKALRSKNPRDRMSF